MSGPDTHDNVSNNSTPTSNSVSKELETILSSDPVPTRLHFLQIN